MPTKIGVAIPVGPAAHHATWLDETLVSLDQQTRPPSHVLIVDDMHGRKLEETVRGSRLRSAGIPIDIWQAPWRLGVATAFNIGCARLFAEKCDLVVMLGADDRLEPRALEGLQEQFEAGGSRDGYYWFDVVYDTGEEQGLPCNAAAVTPGFMQKTGGLPVEASLGGMDATLISAMLRHHADWLIRVTVTDGRYWVRQHENQEGRRLNMFGDAILTVRNVYTMEWKAPEWGRY